jgi:nicotinamidase-related amidase
MSLSDPHAHLQTDPYLAPDFLACALITIDTQCDTLDGGPLEIPGTSAALPNISAILDAFRSAGKQIIHVVRIYKTDGSNVDLCRRAKVLDGAKILAPDSPGVQLASGLNPGRMPALETDVLLSGGFQSISGSEAIMYKPRWGAFYGTQLESYLKGKGINTLIFTGCNFPNCPRTSIYEASERDFKTVLIADAVSGLYDKGRQEMKNIGASLINTSELLHLIGG